ncbi:MAG TPA: hypothetical protein VNX21_06940 [Candidatus Thermoplasmatota archaeon]|nr:hypothetical protein [Candidatus Thermoplasmatota archaeon]
MRALCTAIVLALVLSLAPSPTRAHGACSHEVLHLYPAHGHTSQSMAGVIASDSETGDCDGDGVPLDFDGDLDLGIGGGAFGHGPWATHCGYHQEIVGSISVMDFAFGTSVSLMAGSNDANSWVPDPWTGQNTCLTDGLISPATDPEGDDCVSWAGAGVPVACPGGGDGLLWVILVGPHTSGTLSSP